MTIDISVVLAAHKQWLNDPTTGTKANLRGADLWGADLRGANLREADLREADLREADLWGADLREANLREADLRGADLWGADLRRADLWGASGIISAGFPDGWMAYGWIMDGALSIRVGCQEKRYAEAVAYWSGKDNRREVLAAVEYIRTVADIRGWRVQPC